MESTQTTPTDSAVTGTYLLGIDTCGPLGSVALGRLAGGTVEILGQTEIEGRHCAELLVSVVSDLLAAAGLKVRDLGAMVVVYGPGRFTGVRVGLAAVKGLAEPAGTPVVAMSRLEVLGCKAGAASAALDAHRGEVYLRLGAEARELLAGAAEFAAADAAPARVAVCDDAAAALLGAAWPGAELIRVEAPTAADALRLGAARVAAGAFADLEHLDGHYLRRSDAEIFGQPAVQGA